MLGETTFETTKLGVEVENGAIGLTRTSDRILNEVTVTWGIDDGDKVLGGIEIQEGDIDSDATLAVSLQLVKHPSILQEAFAKFSSSLRLITR